MITPQTLAQIVERVDQVGLSSEGMVLLRQEWPAVHFTCCTEDDVPARLQPVAQGAGFAVFLVSGAQHCVGFTSSLEAATGLVLASTEIS